jgi:hypothetical protein
MAAPTGGPDTWENLDQVRQAHPSGWATWKHTKIHQGNLRNEALVNFAPLVVDGCQRMSSSA